MCLTILLSMHNKKIPADEVMFTNNQRNAKSTIYMLQFHPFFFFLPSKHNENPPMKRFLEHDQM